MKKVKRTFRDGVELKKQRSTRPKKKTSISTKRNKRRSP